MGISLAGFGATIVVSAITHNIMKEKGKQDLADTLNTVTVLGAASYAAFFVYKLIQVSITMFL